MIERVGGKYVLWSRRGVALGTHRTRREAEAQEVAIRISKARAAGHDAKGRKKYVSHAPTGNRAKLNALSRGLADAYTMNDNNQAKLDAFARGLADAYAKVDKASKKTAGRARAARAAR